MAAVDMGDGRQGAELINRIPHLFHAALVDAAAAHGKYRVTGKERKLRRDMESNVAPRVARAGKDHYLTAGPAECVAARHSRINARDLFGLVLGPDDLAAKEFLEPQVSGDMILMVMRGEYMGQLPAKFPEFRLHRRGVRGVNRGGGPGFGIVNYDAVVVGAAHELAHIEMGHIIC